MKIRQAGTITFATGWLEDPLPRLPDVLRGASELGGGVFGSRAVP